MPDAIAQPSCRSPDGRFGEGNRFWQAREAHGRPPLFNDPEQLWNACCAYFHWVEDNPLRKHKTFVIKGKVVTVEIAKMRAMTILGLCNFLGITNGTWVEWRKKRTDLSEIIARVETVIWCQKFEGAAAGLLNARIINRELGNSAKRRHANLDEQSFKPNRITNSEIVERLKIFLNKGKSELAESWSTPT
ncbi:terminase small subunit [Roseovarius aestuarii]|uniref:DNA-packaging protein n=1 Tax=Roseovarius aestuarii TaxID=475083 RepID=A0A1X7BKZ5_9RHOB|nr:terminase small subunit [Roseovarius aestuarii]SMC10313.1 hypothetical protein ROA7745_00119 [Roseovarius aestuarii]